MILAAFLAFLGQVQAVPPAEAQERLAAWAIDDFKAHPPGRALGFRAVRAGTVEHPADAVIRPILCGEMRVERARGGVEWVKFATLETSGGYEQWVGGSAGTWCNDQTRLDAGRDLAPRFEKALVRAK